MFLTGFLTAAVAFAVYAYVLQTGTTATARTSAFAVLVYAELLRSFGARSETKPIWRIALFTNTNLVIVVGISFGLQVLSQHNAVLGDFLKTTAMPLADTFLLLAFGTIPLLVLEGVKMLQNARRQNLASRLAPSPRQGWPIVCLAVKKFSQIDGAQSAAAFAYYALFSLIPFIVLIATFASAFDRNQAGAKTIVYIQQFLPINGAMHAYLANTISAVSDAGAQLSTVALLVFLWAAMRFLKTLISATNKAWGDEIPVTWRLRFKAISVLLASVLLISLVPILTKIIMAPLFSGYGNSEWIYVFANYLLHTLLVFIGLSLFYRLASARLIRFNDVWIAALSATLILQLAGSIFAICLQNVSSLNAIYSVFAGLMALLLWIYFSGGIIIFGACLCAAQAQIRPPQLQAISAITKRLDAKQ